MSIIHVHNNNITTDVVNTPSETQRSYLTNILIQ